MISLLVGPTLHLVKQHMALAGMNLKKSVTVESNGLDVSEVVDNALKGGESLIIVYERGRIQKDQLASKPLTFALTADDGSITKRNAIIGSVPFKISIVTNQLLNLDNYELLHRLELSAKSFPFTLNLPDTPEERLDFLMSYGVTDKANEQLTINPLKGGFHSYSFDVSAQGYLLAPYTNSVDIVTRVDFNLIFAGEPQDKPEPTEGNYILITIPKT